MSRTGNNLTKDPNIEIRRTNSKAYFMKNTFCYIVSQKIQKYNFTLILKIT